MLTPQDAARAIYVDFESLGTAIDRPAILGSLVAGETDGVFQQFVLDEALATATVARKNVCIDASPEAAVTAVVDIAERESRLVVSWSTHERAVVRAVCAANLADRFAAVHRNALDTARKWKRSVYPAFPFALKRFGGKHPLKQYLRMVAYPLPAAIRPATPAKWLRHTLQQMHAHDGRYRRITHEAKRDWHRLLVYNEHDCRGMHAVVTQAARELDLWIAYERARYVVVLDDREVTICPGFRNPELDELLSELGASRWAFLTAYNPESTRRGSKENERRQASMRAQLASSGYTLLASEGRDASGLWPPEPSVLVLGISRREARQVGRQYGQLAILVGHRGFPGRLVPTGLDPGRRHRTEKP